ncbi:MAG: peptidase MA family metallohydrolase [Candidatus Omnitrophota bacterium]
MLRLKLFFLFLFMPLFLFAQDQQWRIFKSTHFLVYYNAAPEDILNRLTQRAEEYYNEITNDLGFNRLNFWTWDDRAKIYLFDTQEEYMRATGTPDWSAGQTMASSKVIRTFITAPDFLDNILPHEMGHIIFREMVGFNNPAIPLWLEEGVATYQEKQRTPGIKKYLAGQIHKGSFMGLAGLESFELANSKDKEKVELFYLESYSLLDYLIKEFGKDKFVLFCQNLRDYKDLTRALALAYSFGGLEDFESSWKARILQ